jgi:hypothetical protein
LVIIGVHTPEFAFEKDADNVARAIQRFGVHYPVAMDDDYAIWRAFGNEYWPADYFVDALGRIRTQHFGEGDYHHAEDVIRALLAEAGYTDLPGGYVDPSASGAEAAAPADDERSPETYVGYERTQNFAGGALARNEARDYRVPPALGMNQWAFEGRWTDHAHDAELDTGPGAIAYHFEGRDLHLVMGPASDGGAPVRFRVTIDGHAPGRDHGADTDAEGYGSVTAQRLYQLVRQADGTGARQVTITFLAPGVRVYAFTFG